MSLIDLLLPSCQEFPSLQIWKEKLISHALTCSDLHLIGWSVRFANLTPTDPSHGQWWEWFDKTSPKSIDGTQQQLLLSADERSTGLEAQPSTPIMAEKTRTNLAHKGSWPPNLLDNLIAPSCHASPLNVVSRAHLMPFQGLQALVISYNLMKISGSHAIWKDFKPSWYLHLMPNHSW